MMTGFKNTVAAIWSFYRDGFRNMTWGRTLIWLILLKVVILFAVLRVFFFRPAMAGLSEQERSEAVGERLTETGRGASGRFSDGTYDLQ